MEIGDLSKLNDATWDGLTMAQPAETLTPVESVYRTSPSVLSEPQRYFFDTGVLVLDRFFTSEQLDRYAEAREKLPKDRTARDNFWGGWAHPTSYMDCPPMLDLATNPLLQHIMMTLVGYPMGLHLALTGWISTERNWHQDSYLNPDYLWSHYLAVWIALDDVDPDAGPFEYVPESHKWPVLRREKLFRYLTPAQRKHPAWPTFTQDRIAALAEKEIERRQAPVEKFIPKKGDVLIWHSNLLHRGSPPQNRELLRKGLICHYSSLVHRMDMDKMRRHPSTGNIYFDIPGGGAVPAMAGPNLRSV